jgi:tRNA(Ile)-lysidine synthase
MELYGKKVGKKVHLPYGLMAKRTYTGICLAKISQTGEKTEPYPESFPLILDETGCAGMILPGRKGRLFFRLWDIGNAGKRRVEAVTDREIRFSDGEIIKIPESSCVKWFDYDKIDRTVVVRTRRPGDRLMIHPDGQRKKLKDYWIDQKVPQEDRDRKWLLAAGSDILWIFGERTGESCRIDTGTGRILAVQLDEVLQEAES